MELEKLPNIGIKLAEKLRKAGIKTSEELIAGGSKEAFLKIRMELDDGCFSMLQALEGAVQGIRRHFLSKEKKAELKEFYSKLAGK